MILKGKQGMEPEMLYEYVDAMGFLLGLCRQKGLYFVFLFALHPLTPLIIEPSVINTRNRERVY